MRKIYELKIKCKELAAEIRTAKAELKVAFKDKNCSINAYSMMMSKLHYKQVAFRCYHIAYCELRGRTREQIEPKVREYNQIDYNSQKKIDQIKSDYAWEVKDVA